MYSKEEYSFKKAVPVWLTGREKEVNLQAVFTSNFCAKSGDKIKLVMTGATLYRVFLNEKFIHYGPARGPHGYVRIDCIDLTAFLTDGENTIRIEVAGYNCPTFYTLNQTSFIQAEILQDEEVILCTGKDFKGFADTRRLQKYVRYSYQRSFAEHWILDEKLEIPHGVSEIRIDYEYLLREVPYPIYDKKEPIGMYKKYGFEYDPDVKCELTRCLDSCEEGFLRFDLNEITFNPFFELQKLKFNKPAASGVDTKSINTGEYLLIDMGANKTGFMLHDIIAHSDSRLIISFDEILVDSGLDVFRNGSVNAVTYDLTKQDKPYIFQSFECYCFRYVFIILLSGSITLNKFSVVEYVAPDVTDISLNSDDDELNEIFDAARETYRQNTLDVFMDCPGRERAGWLCDSYFTAQSAMFFSGSPERERVFLDNFVLAKEFTNIPKGMLPMAYPGDHNSGVFIPQWALWYIIELEQYEIRSKDSNMERFRPLCFNLLEYFKKFENEDGLLESLNSWNFIEWSIANEYVRDVHYPTNMLYSKALKIVGGLFSDRKLIEKSEKVKSEVIKQSFDGNYFVDNAVRNKEGKLIVTNNRTEVCQYFSFFFDIAEYGDKTYSGLIDKIINIFGPKRKEKNELAEIGFANAFIGNFLRMEILLKWGLYDRITEEAKGYFGKMARLTGTLWENDSTVSSLNHGFASYIGVVLYKCFNH